MVESRTRPKLAPALTGIPEVRRHEPKVRRELSGPAIRTFLQIAEKWDLSSQEQRGLLGWPPESTFRRFQLGRAGTLSYDVLIRISLVIGIYQNLHALYPEDELADGWMKLPNENPLFGGKSAILFLMDTGMDGLYQLRRLLDARRGGWN